MAFTFAPICQALLAKGAKVNATGKFYDTPVLSAVALKHPDVVKLLLDHGANVEKGGVFISTPLDIAAGTGQTEVVRMLLDKGAKVENNLKENVHPLASAVSHSHIAVVKLLLMHGAPVNGPTDDDGATALMLAAQTGNLDVLRLLLQNGADRKAADKAGRTAVDYAEGDKRDAIVAALKANGS